MNKVFWSLGLWLVTFMGYGQGGMFSEEKSLRDKCQYYFDHHSYGQAYHLASDILGDDEMVATDDRTDFFYFSNIRLISALRLNDLSAEAKIQAYIHRYYPNPLITPVIFELANYYYNQKNYVECIEYFEMIDLNNLSIDKVSELNFKRGYAHFVRKEFRQAELLFDGSRNVQNRFFYPTNYYYALCKYFLDDYDAAVVAFRRVEDHPLYQSLIPYYLAQIYFAQGKYAEVIQYGERVIQKPGIKNVDKIRLIIGQALFAENNFDRALPHLEYYEQKNEKLTIDEFYQLGFAYYQLGRCKDAIRIFLEINRTDSKIGQLVNYYMADCYLKDGNLNSARAALKRVSEMDYDSGMKEESRYNYGKLSAQMGLDREALNVLLSIPPKSPHYREARKIINDILSTTGDFEKAIEIMDGMDDLTDDLKSTYQKIAFKQSIQEYLSGHYEEAEKYFAKAEKYPIDPNIQSQIDFWRASYISDIIGDTDRGIEAYKKYFSRAAKAKKMPVITRPYLAHYGQAYNYLKNKDFLTAAEHFKKTITGINTENDPITNRSITDRILPDAYARAGDCYFKERRFDDAVTYYDQYIEQRAPGYDYAIFQRALIEGLLNQPYEKILTLENLLETNPESDYADDALVQLGDTYLQLGNLRNAGIAYRRLINEYGGKSNLLNAAYLKLGLIHYNSGDVEGALSHYKEVFNHNPNAKESQEAMIAIEEIYIDDLGQPDEFFAFAQSIPGFEVSSFAKDSIKYIAGEVQYQNGNYEKAIDAFSDYLDGHPYGYYRLDAHYYRGESYALLRKYSKALRDYEYLIKEGINDYYGKALKKAALISYNHKKDFSKAAKYYKAWEKYTHNEDEKYQAQKGVMRSAYLSKKYGDVNKYAGMILQNPLSTPEDKTLARYYRGMAYYYQGEKDEADRSLRLVKGSDEYAAEARYIRAKILYEKGMLDKAIESINAANEKNGNFPYWIAKGVLLAADIYMDQGDLLNARAAVEAVLENFKGDSDIEQLANQKLHQIENMESGKNRVLENNQKLLMDDDGN